MHASSMKFQQKLVSEDQPAQPHVPKGLLVGSSVVDYFDQLFSFEANTKLVPGYPSKKFYEETNLHISSKMELMVGFKIYVYNPICLKD